MVEIANDKTPFSVQCFKNNVYEEFVEDVIKLTIKRLKKELKDNKLYAKVNYRISTGRSFHSITIEFTKCRRLESIIELPLNDYWLFESSLEVYEGNSVFFDNYTYLPELNIMNKEKIVDRLVEKYIDYIKPVYRLAKMIQIKA